VLGRSGVVVVSEIGELQIGGQVHALAAQGLDPFQLLVLPRACALAIACLTLGVIFVTAALLSGFVAGSVFGALLVAIWRFLDRVLLAMRAGDFAVFPAKMIVIGPRRRRARAVAAGRRDTCHTPPVGARSRGCNAAGAANHPQCRTRIARLTGPAHANAANCP
jgi:Permease MlaE